MREVFSSRDSTIVGYYKSILDEAGITSFIQNENTNSPMPSGGAFTPTLCVVDDEDYDEAVGILKSQLAPDIAGGAEWTCPSCSEKNPGNFELCWNCKSPRPTA